MAGRPRSRARAARRNSGDWDDPPRLLPGWDGLLGRFEIATSIWRSGITNYARVMAEIEQLAKRSGSAYAEVARLAQRGQATAARLTDQVDAIQDDMHVMANESPRGPASADEWGPKQRKRSAQAQLRQQVHRLRTRKPKAKKNPVVKKLKAGQAHPESSHIFAGPEHASTSVLGSFGGQIVVLDGHTIIDRREYLIVTSPRTDAWLAFGKRHGWKRCPQGWVSGSDEDHYGFYVPEDELDRVFGRGARAIAAQHNPRRKRR